MLFKFTTPDRGHLTIAAPTWYQARRVAMREFGCGPDDLTTENLANGYADLQVEMEGKEGGVPVVTDLRNLPKPKKRGRK
jgi:hypothetical protein